MMTTYDQLCQAFSNLEATQKVRQERIIGVFRNYHAAIVKALGIHADVLSQPVANNLPCFYAEVKNKDGQFIPSLTAGEFYFTYPTNSEIEFEFRLSVVLVSNTEAKKTITIPCLISSKDGVETLSVGGGQRELRFTLDGITPALPGAVEHFIHLVFMTLN